MMSEASVGDYDVMACTCPTVHASVLIFVPVCVTRRRRRLRNAEPQTRIVSSAHEDDT